MGMVGQSNNILLVNLKVRFRSIIQHPRVLIKTCIECPLEFSSGCGEAVEDEVFANTIHPLAAGGEGAADEVPAIPLAGGEGPHDLALHVHDNHAVGSVADNHLVHVPGHHMDTVDVDIATGCASQGLECVLTLGGFCVPDLDSSVARGAAMRLCKVDKLG